MKKRPVWIICIFELVKDSCSFVVVTFSSLRLKHKSQDISRVLYRCTFDKCTTDPDVKIQVKVRFLELDFFLSLLLF